MQENNPVPVVEQLLPVQAGKQNNFLTILLSVLLIISVAISGFFAYQTQKLVKELTLLRSEPIQVAISEPTFEPGLEPEPIPLEILTKDWKTYTNTKYGYSISYLSTYNISNVADGSDGTVPVNADNISLSESKNSKYEDRLLDLSYQGYLVDISPSDQWQKTSVTVAGIKASKYTKIDKSVNFDYYHIPSKGTEGIELMVNNRQIAKVDQILSTFKFLD